MDFTGLGQMAYKPIRGLSKGMKQRLCLGRALIHDPSVLILDEPAAGLDPHARIELRQIILALAADGKTILVSSHILTELAEICDRVGIIEQGRLLATGTVDEMRQAKRTTREIVVHIGSDPVVATRLIESLEGASQLRVNGHYLRFALTGGDQRQIEVLRTLVNERIDVISFAAKDDSLEDVFLHVTRGRIQ